MVSRVRGLALAVGLAIVPPSAQSQQDAKAVSLTLTRLAIDIEVDYGRRSIHGAETLHLRSNGPGAPLEVPLLLNRLMTVSRITDAAGRELRFSQGIVTFEDDSMLQVNAAVVRLGRGIPANDSLSFTVHYAGRLVGYTETGSLYIRDNISRDFTIIRADAFAFPVLGRPSWRTIRSMRREAFTFSARVTAPADLKVAMGGRSVASTRQDSLVSWTYESDGPVPFLNISIAPYQVLDSGGIRVFYFPADSTGARMVARAIRSAIGRYTTWYGTLGQEPRLTVTEIPEGWGSQASLTAGIIQTADAFRDRGELPQLYHELSHLWNAPDLDPPSPRWNEGLASFLQWRMAAELDGWDGWDARLDRVGQTLTDRCNIQGLCATVPFADYGKAGLTDLSYQVGLLMFYGLYKTLGPDAFDRAYRELFQEHRNGVTTADLVAAFTRANAVSERVFSDWLLTPRWYTRLAAGQSVHDILNDYKSR